VKIYLAGDSRPTEVSISGSIPAHVSPLNLVPRALLCLDPETRPVVQPVINVRQVSSKIGMAHRLGDSSLTFCRPAWSMTVAPPQCRLLKADLLFFMTCTASDVYALRIGLVGFFLRGVIDWADVNSPSNVTVCPITLGHIAHHVAHPRSVSAGHQQDFTPSFRTVPCLRVPCRLSQVDHVTGEGVKLLAYFEGALCGLDSSLGNLDSAGRIHTGL
jgi:hypothetical protein